MTSPNITVNNAKTNKQNKPKRATYVSEAVPVFDLAAVLGDG